VRIISGNLKGRNILLPKGSPSRPTPERIREAVFNMIAHRVPGAVCVDLFAGSGAMGIEALSRGAAYVLFCDKWAPAVQSIRENLKTFGVSGSMYSVAAADFLSCRAQLSACAPIDIAFLDPPYHEGYYQPAMELLEPYMAPGGLIIAESEASERLSESCLTFTCVESRKYSSSRVWFYRKAME